MHVFVIVHSRSLGSWVGLKKLFKIKVLLTYVFYVTIVIMCNMRAQLLMFQNGVFSLDSCYGVNTWFYRKKIASGMLISLFQ